MLALVSPGVLVPAGGTGAPNVSVREEPVAFRAKKLFQGVFLDKAVLFEIKENPLVITSYSIHYTKLYEQRSFTTRYNLP